MINKKENEQVKMKILISIVMVLFLISFVSATNYYVDASATYNGDGTTGTQAAGVGQVGAFNTWSSVTFSNADDYYQKCGTTETRSSTLIVSGADGTQEDRIIIGAYYLDGETEIIGVFGNKPIIDRTTAVAGSALWVTGVDYLTVKNFDLRRGTTCFRIDDADYIIIEDNAIGLGTLIYGLRVMALDGNQCGYGIIRNNIVDSGLAIYGQDVGNLTDGIKLGGTGHHFEIYNNNVVDWGHDGIRVVGNSALYGVGASYNKIYANKITAPTSNYCRGVSYDGLEGYCSHNQVYFNLIQDTKIRSQIGGTYNSFYYNIIDTVSDRSGRGQGICLQGYNGPVKYNKIYNNLIYNTAEEGIRLYNNVGDDVVTANEIINNIILEPGNYGIYIYNRLTLEENIFKNNFIYKVGETDIVYYYGILKTVAEFNNATGHSDTIADNIGTDPRLADPTNGDFHLQSTSPVIDAGIDVGLTTDFEGNLIPFGAAPDIGAYEYIGDLVSSCGDADSDFSGVVSITELINYITGWKAGNVNINDLINGITEWKNGC